MPLVNPNDSAPEQPRPSIQQIAAPQYKGVTVDTKVEPVSHLLTHVEGSSWIVNYYSQVLNTDSSTAGQGLGTAPLYQQYKLIVGMELKVTQPLTTSQDSETKNLQHVGGATVYPFVIPNEGDMFLADIGSGREGLFQVTEVTRMAVFKQAVHTIEYRMVDYSTPVHRADLTQKTVQTLHYSKDFLTHGQNPLLFEDDYAVAQWLRRNYRSLAERYFKSFFSREYSTMVLPGQMATTYDHYLTKALLTHFTTWDTQEVRYVRVLNVDDDYALRATQVWDALTKRDKSLLRDSFLQVGRVSTIEFSYNALFEGIRYSGIQEVVYPVDPLLTVDYRQVSPEKLVLGPLVPGPVQLRSVSSLINGLPLREVIPETTDAFNLLDADGNPISSPTPPIIHRTMKDDYYVFSKAFYENNRDVGEMSQLELAVHDYLDEQPLDHKQLKRFCEDMEDWNSLDKFYFTPVVLLLMKSTINGL